MLARALSLCIVLFWLASIGWLSAVIWAPAESRMAEVNPREVYETFFAWNEQTDMTLLENGSRRGQLRITGSSGRDTKADAFVKSGSFSATLERFDEAQGVPEAEAFLRGGVDFSRELAFRRSFGNVRVPDKGLEAVLNVGSEPFAYEVKVSLGGISILNFNSSTGKLPEIPAPMKAMIGGDLETLDPTTLALEVEARQGRFAMGGRDMDAYLLIVSAAGREESFRVYLSRAGEPLKIETGFGLEAISEILVPLDAYLEPEKDKE